MPQVCFYFELHQPYRLGEYSVFDVGSKHSYFKSSKKDVNKEVFQKVSKKSYIPMLTLLYKLVKKYPDFVFTFSCSGVFLEQAKAYAPEVLELLQKLVKTKQVEVLSETYYHSLSSLYSPTEFKRQVQLHTKIVKKLFGITPKVFRNTELIFSNEIAQLVAEQKFIGMLTDGVDYYLRGESKTHVLRTDSLTPLPLLLKHPQLSDDIAFRFSDKTWAGFPLNAETYVRWLNDYHEDEYINLFMDFETFGEHQWEDTGIFKFFEAFVGEFRKHSWNKFVTPTEVFEKMKAEDLPVYSVANPISWADVLRDLSAWRDNDLQVDALKQIYAMEGEILASKSRKLIEDWRKLQISDHFYYMCIKWSADGDVHAYFSPYNDPHEAYVRYSTALADLKGRLLEKNGFPGQKHTF